MTKEQIITACKLACRISSTALDTEFSDLIDAAFLDLEESGIALRNPVSLTALEHLILLQIVTSLS